MVADQVGVLAMPSSPRGAVRDREVCSCSGVERMI